MGIRHLGGVSRGQMVRQSSWRRSLREFQESESKTGSERERKKAGAEPLSTVTVCPMQFAGLKNVGPGTKKKKKNLLRT